MGCGGENAFLTRGSAGFGELTYELPTAWGCWGAAGGGGFFAIAANAERMETGSGGFSEVEAGPRKRR